MSSGVDGRELSRVTSGNPFLVVEALAAGDGLPSTVRDATLARVGRLDADARGVVDAAAVIGQRVAPGLLAAVAPGSAGAVEGALACGVLTEDGGELVFRHELTRQAVESSIAAPRRAALHARVLAALADGPEHRDDARMAHHAERGGWRPRQAGSARWQRQTPNASVRCARRDCSSSGHCASGST